MQPSPSRTSALARITLVCLLVVLLGLLPYPVQLWEYSRQARAAAAQQPARAAAAYHEVLRLQPWRSDLWEQVGRFELQAGQPQEGIAALEKARSLSSLSADGWLALANAYQQNRQSGAALDLWREYLRRFGPSALVYTRLLAVQRAAGDLDAAAATLQAWQALEPTNSRLAYQRGLLLLASDPTAALNLMLQSAREDPSLAPGVEILRKAVGQTAASAEPAYGKVILGRALGSLGEWDLARRFFLEAVRFSPDYAEAWAFLGETRQNLGENGFPDLEKAAKLSPNSVIVQALLSVYWRRQGQPKQALAALEKIRQKEPGQIIWQIETGNTLAESGDLVAAQPYFDQAAALEPGNPAAWLALADFSVQYDVDVSGLGLPAARKALLLAPDNPAIMDVMGRAFFKLGDLASAERFLQRSLQQNSAQPAVSLHLGQVYLQQNRLDLAYAHLVAALRLDDQGPVGAIARRLLSTYYPDKP